MASDIYKAVRILKVTLVLLLALAWVPLSLHCQIEALPGLEFLACESGVEEHPVPHQSTDCEEDFCQVVESGLYKTEEQAPLLSLASSALPALASALALLAQPPDRKVSSAPDISPPPLATSWQFALRTALPPRAPSLVS